MKNFSRRVMPFFQFVTSKRAKINGSASISLLAVRKLLILIIIPSLLTFGQIHYKRPFQLGRDSVTLLIKSLENQNSSIKNLLKQNDKEILLKEKLENRFSLLNQLALTSPTKCKQYVLDNNIKSKIPFNLQPLIEKEVNEITGNVCLVIYDSHDFSQSKEEFYLNTPKGTYLLRSEDGNLLKIKNGERVTVTNSLLLGDVLLINDKNILNELKYTSTVPKIKDIKMLVVLYTYLDGDTTITLTADDFKEKIFGNRSVIQDWIKEVSYGNARISELSVVGWVKLNRRYADGAPNKEEFDQMVEKYQIDLNKYDFWCNVENSNNIDYAGYAGIGKSYSPWIGKIVGSMSVSLRPIEQHETEILTPSNFSTFSHVFVHELGHTFGFGHSQSFYPDSGYINSHKYGDQFGAMGGSISGHYRGYFKESVGWLDSTNILTVDKSGDYTINNFEARNGKRLAKIKLGNPDQPKYLYLEYRNGSGFDSNFITNDPFHRSTKGLFLLSNQDYFSFQVGTAPNSDANYGNSYLISAGKDENNWTPTLNDTMVYSDSIKNFTLGPIISRTDSTIKFRVQLLKKNPEYPRLELPVNNWSSPSTTKFIDLTWSKVSSASSYELQISCSSVGSSWEEFQKIYLSKILTENSIRLTLPRDQYYWRVRSIDELGNKSDWSIPFLFYTWGIDTSSSMEEVISDYILAQNYPNPFNPVTRIRFGLPENAITKLIIYDVLGREIETLINSDFGAGYHEVEFNGSNLPSGIYIYRIKAGEFTSVKKMILMK